MDSKSRKFHIKYHTFSDEGQKRKIDQINVFTPIDLYHGMTIQKFVDNNLKEDTNHAAFWESDPPSSFSRLFKMVKFCNRFITAGKMDCKYFDGVFTFSLGITKEIGLKYYHRNLR